MEQSGEVGMNRGGMQRTNAYATCMGFFVVWSFFFFFLNLSLSEQPGARVGAVNTY